MGQQETTPPAATTQTTYYRYDALGRRIDKTGEFGATRFGWDGDLLSLEIRGSKQSEYLYEPDSFVPLAKLESAAHVQRPEHKAINPKKVASLFKATPSDSEQNEAPAHASQAQAAIETEVEATTAKAKDFAVFYYQCDQIGAPQELTDEQGNIVWAAEYKVWGRTSTLEVSATGTDNLDPYDLNRFWPGGPRDLKARSSSTTQALNHVEQNLRFQGQYHDHESGLHYNRFRYYDSQTGRFVHQDPIGIEGGVNLFYFAPNPFSWIDPIGLSRSNCKICPICGGATKGRANKQARLRELANDPKQPRWVRGWIKNEMRHIETGNRKTIRLPGNSRNSPGNIEPGKELAHGRTTEAKDGYCYLHSTINDADLHKLQHRIGGY